MGLGTFMSALDTSVVNIALPVIGRDTGAPASTLEWVILSYLITVTASLLVFGRLADIHGRRRIYMLGLLIFTLSSAGCGLASTVGFLIAMRAVQAVGAAMILALGPAILVTAFPANERGQALGLSATMTYLGTSIGPGLGGLLTEHFGWPAIFLMNIPLGVLLLWIAWRELPQGGTFDKQPFDPAGAAAMAIGLVGLLFALSKGSEYGWRNPWICTAGGVGILALVSLVIIENKIPHPALDLRLFNDRRFSASILAAWLCYLTSAAISFLMPFYLQEAAGLQPARAGLIMMFVPIGMLLLTAASGRFSDRVGVRLPATTGMLLMAAGAFLLATMGLGNSIRFVAGYLFLTGVGAGMFTAPNNSAIMGAAPPNRQGVAGALLATARTMGFTTGVAVAAFIYTHTSGTAANLAPAIQQAVRWGLYTVSLTALAAAGCSLFRGGKRLSNSG